MSDFMTDLFDKFSDDPTTQRDEEIAKYGGTRGGGTITVKAHRRGKPNADMTGVTVDKRWISVTLTKEGRPPQAIHMSHKVAACISSDLMRAALKLQREENVPPGFLLDGVDEASTTEPESEAQ